MQKAFLVPLLFASLILSAQAVQVNLAAGASSDLSVTGVTGPLLAFTGASFTNGNTAATINFDPYLAVSFSSSLSAALSASTIASTAAIGLGIQVTANSQGSGTLTIKLSAATRALAGSASQWVLVSTPVATASGSASEAVFIPPTSTDFGTDNSISWSIAFQRNYVIAALKVGAQVGVSASTAFQAAFNTTSKIAANTYTTFSASCNAKSTTNTNTASSSATANGNAYIQFGNGAVSSDAVVTVAQNFFGASASGKTYVAPSGTNGNIGVQFSINKQSGTFNGNLTFNSNGQGSFNAASAAAYSWYKAASGTVDASGWVKVASTSSLDANGNLQVFAQQSGDFSEWTVATSGSSSSASAVVAGVVALSAIVAFVF